VVSVTTYRDAGFLPQAFVNFVCLLGWSPKDDRERMSGQELVDAFSFEGINRSNAVVNFREDDPFDPKAVWLNAQHLMALPVEELAGRLLPFARAAGFDIQLPQLLPVVPLIRERIKTLRDVATVADFFFAAELAPYDPAELIPQKGDAAMALAVLQAARPILEATPFTHPALDAALRAEAVRRGWKAGQMFQPIRVAACGRKAAPPLFETLEVLGRATCLKRIDRAILKLNSAHGERM
jgi:glutamyl-tRNA synthetase